MWPWGHAAVGYLLYAGVTRWRYRHAPTAAAVWTLALGTQFPDVVDKPLAWAGYLPEGRALAHSLLFAVPLCVGIVEFTRQSRWRKAGVAFGVGYASHLLADSWQPLLALKFSRVTYLVWPLLPPPNYPKNGVADHLRALLTDVHGVGVASVLAGDAGGVVYQLAFAILVMGLWVVDGMPGLLPTKRD